MCDLTGHIVVVTGACGQLGRGFCAALADSGARVAALDLPHVVADAGPPHATDHLMTIAGDVTSRASLEEALKTIEARWGAPTGLVNNAGLDTPPGAGETATGSLETFDMEVWHRTFEVNSTGALLAMQVFGGRMAQAQRGAIVNIGSIYGQVGPDQRIYDYRAAQGRPFVKPVAYSASKAALLGLTRYAATYWAPNNVRVNALVLGGAFAHQDPEFVEAYTARVPLARMAQPHEFHGGLTYLLSDASSYVTGTSLVIDGGWTAW